MVFLDFEVLSLSFLKTFYFKKHIFLFDTFVFIFQSSIGKQYYREQKVFKFHESRTHSKHISDLSIRLLALFENGLELFSLHFGQLSC